jgi:hypothetical protein
MWPKRPPISVVGVAFTLGRDMEAHEFVGDLFERPHHAFGTPLFHWVPAYCGFAKHYLGLLARLVRGERSMIADCKARGATMLTILHHVRLLAAGKRRHAKASEVLIPQKDAILAQRTFQGVNGLLRNPDVPHAASSGKLGKHRGKQNSVNSVACKKE